MDRDGGGRDNEPRKRPHEFAQSSVPAKKSKPSKPYSGSGIPDENVSGWQAALGSSLADQLEHLTVKKNLTARQVKKLLRAVLTNEDVISAFRRYINLSEPETGEISASTKRRARDLGLLSESSEDLQSTVSQSLEPRVITRSLARTIQHSLREYFPQDTSAACKEPSTILDMEFPEEDDEGTFRCKSFSVDKDVDEDYLPGPLDFCILERNRALDVSIDGDAPPDFTQSRLEESGISTQCEEHSQQSSSTDDSTSAALIAPSTSNNWLLEDNSTEGDSSVNDATEMYADRLRSSHAHETNNVLIDPESNVVSNSDELPKSSHQSDLEGHTNIKVTNSAESSIVLSDDPVEYVNDVDDDVYAEFLRSLFASNGSTHTTPTKKTRLPSGDTRTHISERLSGQSSDVEVPKSSIEHQSNPTGVEGVEGEEDEEDEDDPDDPEFDVMAELDQVDRDDFIDELRDDRAVRVSKMEAKSLHQDMRELFSDEEGGNQNDNRLDRPNASTVFAMKSHCHRLLSRFPKIEQPDEPEDPENVPDPSDDEPDECLAESLPAGHLNRLHGPLPKQHEFSPDQLLQLQRQLGMHVQLLTTQFLCTYDFSHLHLSVTRPCASALRELASRRDAFDLMASQQLVQASTGEPTGFENNNVRSFYWSCPSLSEAVRLISDYAGLSLLPRIPKHLNRSGGAPVIDTGHQAGFAAQRRSFAANHLPLPLCLIRLMTGNPIWSYPYLMPCILPALYEPPEVPQRRRRLAFHPPEDALILLGLDDFSATFLPPAENTEPAVPTLHDDLQSHQSRYLTYRMVRKHLLPHRTLLQLRTRRWNLLSSFSANKLKARSLTPLATSRLYELYVDVPHRAPLNKRLLRTFAEEVSKCSIPQHIPLRSGCLSDMPSEELFRRDGLPRQVGYETVLLNLSTERPCRGELSKLVHDMLTDFVQQAECLWWCWWSHEKVGVRPRLTASDRPVASEASYVSEQTVLKPEGTDSAQRDLSMLGPTFLPAIPVDFTPDGNVILSKNAEPALVEINMATSVPASMPPTTSVMATNCRSTETVTLPKPPCITDHIEAVLAEIRKQAAFQSEHRYHSRRRLSCQLNPRTLKQLASPSPLSGKLPIPRLSSQRTSLLPRRGSKTVKAKNNASNLLPASKASIQLVRPSSQVSNTVVPMSNPIDPTLMGMYCSLNRCQKYVDSLVNQFHCGFDKLVSDSGEALFGPFKFPNPVSNRRFPTGQPGHTEGSAPSDNQVVSHTGAVNTQQQQPISVFPNSCFLTANRFLTRCKARNEATTADLLTLPSSTLPHKRSVLDEFDVHRARSLLDRFRVYLTPTDYGLIVLSLRQMNQVVYDTGATRLSVAQHQKDILLCLASILDQLRGHPFLWEDFLCLLTADQAKQLGLLPVYLDLVRVGRVQRVLQDLVPRGKRFWRRLRNLADSYDAEDRPVPPKRAILEQNEQSDQALSSSLKPVLSQTNSSTPCTRFQQVKRNHKLLRGKHVRTRFVRFPLPRTWAFLESTWRGRPILMSQIACLLNTHHKPYSGFEQAFEEIDLLARQPLGRFHPNTPFSEATTDFVCELADGWEVCTALSASVRRLGLGAGSQVTNKNCPCSCHPIAITTSLSGKPLKPDSLNSRHCMSCGLKVHHGIVYVEESNFHLRNVQIIWPANFRLKTRLTPLVSHVVSQPNTGRMGTTPFGSTRAMLARLAELHARSNEDDSFTNVLPDLARRRVSLEFLPPSVKLESPQTPIVSVQEDIVLRQGKGEADDVVQATSPPSFNPPVDREGNEEDGEGQSSESSETPVAGEFTRSPEHSTSPAHWLLDDEAACFNTEAFSSQDSSRCWQSTTGGNRSTWHSDEDRQLLEFCKARGRYSSTMFVDLARCWVPKPFAHSCCRTAIELETRFKRLMRRALGDAYDPELFRSPERESSDDGD
ncbi:hypothetical protein PHET_04841 [Paragonimus heterotremus]|uniref:Uncharacterized protein n=1 Tax=Paragonimus heterotremus TaxID=100268 RepID=A0A8J4TFP9_9TREM|nr:hypothetical protein PHET_04841 [Paragonimus heterotremus]